MDWKIGHRYSVKLSGVAEPQVMIYRFEASSGDRFRPELPRILVFTNEAGDQINYRDNDITSVVSIAEDTNLVVDLRDSSAVAEEPSTKKDAVSSS